MLQNKISAKICAICGKQTEACEALKPADFADERRENVESHGMLQTKRLRKSAPSAGNKQKPAKH
ncbi:hypothetical protein ESY86_00055 [Subsaximicrobium wynnwilliamsii]|uniref:Uncharacterized protein n=1 Tax=Subsaximicrobium wynnwilliamsii TaxID=291179 RepID=A0A5C6ZMH6_9FLAO|nr:hypothetical protein [Subsaximicrobium wynnwilliamsii]TXD81644.1 hypothetical protein ESY87_17415 [Subsaximicrobium wynnwilliamsii]TXD91029.1 hypothetical protein ESY86_00055 [Subsaximicrobium wynnwilliamsii]TXE01092.1 hypothetical protein ESY88_17410 [Subsaximicrobium wynnwilliamsii]